MADTTYPDQTRNVDPYSSYNSNVVNLIHKLATRGADCIDHHHAVDAEISDSTSVIISTGIVYKDQVLIEFTSSFTVNMTDSDFYIPHANPWDRQGYYYIAVNYSYVKARPAPQASIRILRPDQRSHITDAAYLFLKAVLVQGDGDARHIVSIHDYDPTNVTVKREYVPVWAGVEYTLPTFDQEEHESKLIYVIDQNELFFGLSNRWESFANLRDVANTGTCTVGQLAYLAADGNLHPAIATDFSTLAQVAVIQTGTKTTGGKARLYGRVDNVSIEPGRTISEGEGVYLSSTTPGAITDSTAVFTQSVGVCVEEGSHTISCDIWFMPYISLEIQLNLRLEALGREVFGDAYETNPAGPSSRVIGEMIDGDTTPDLSDHRTWKTNSSAPTTITNFDGCRADDERRIIFTDSNTTFQHNVYITLQGGADFVGVADDTLSLIFDGSTWYELSRSLNS